MTKRSPEVMMAFLAVPVATRARLSHLMAELPQSTIAKPRLPPRRRPCPRPRPCPERRGLHDLARLPHPQRPPRPQLRAKPRTQSPRSSLRALTARALPVSTNILPAVLLELNPPPPRFSTEAGAKTGAKT